MLNRPCYVGYVHPAKLGMVHGCLHHRITHWYEGFRKCAHGWIRLCWFCLRKFSHRDMVLM